MLTSSGGLSPAAGTTTTITATVTQPHLAVTPTGSVTFTYLIDAGTANAGLCGAGGTQTVNLNGSGVASFQLPTLGQGLQYTVNATYNGDTNDSLTSAVPLVITVPGVQETVTANSVSYTYGSAVPAITGTVTPAPASAGLTFISKLKRSPPFPCTRSRWSLPWQLPAAAASSAAVTSSNGPATVTENPAALTVVVPAYTTVYGAASFNFASGIKITGAVGNDLAKFSATFTRLFLGAG